MGPGTGVEDTGDKVDEVMGLKPENPKKLAGLQMASVCKMVTLSTPAFNCMAKLVSVIIGELGVPSHLNLDVQQELSPVIV